MIEVEESKRALSGSEFRKSKTAKKLDRTASAREYEPMSPLLTNKHSEGSDTLPEQEVYEERSRCAS